MSSPILLFHHTRDGRREVPNDLPFSIAYGVVDLIGLEPLLD